jgi:hypothetical protein
VFFVASSAVNESRLLLIGSLVGGEGGADSSTRSRVFDMHEREAQRFPVPLGPPHQLRLDFTLDVALKVLDPLLGLFELLGQLG